MLEPKLLQPQQFAAKLQILVERLSSEPTSRRGSSMAPWMFVLCPIKRDGIPSPIFLPGDMKSMWIMQAFAI